jgi:DNA-binding GntR family transcriptional regulator
MEMFSLGATPADLDRDAPESLHSQISDSLRSMIASGQWPAKFRLKAEPDLARELGVSRGTLRRALQTLTEDGILTQVQGRGTFVADARPAAPVAQKLSTLSEDFASQGIPLQTSVISAELVTPPASVARALKVPRGQTVLLLVRVRGTDEHAVALLHNYVRTDVAPGIETIDFAEVTLFSVLEERYGLEIDSARRTFSAIGADAAVAERLSLAPGAPVQLLQQLTVLVDGRPVEYSDVWIDSAQLRITTHLARR